jgi:hypothetical protein
MKRTARKILLGTLTALALVVVAFVLRVTVFVPRFDVPSIAAAAEYKDPALMEEAWSLPVAAAYQRRVVSQSNGSFCGPSTLANALRSLGSPASTEAAILSDTGKCRIGLCIPGLTLDELADIARQKTDRKVTVLRDLTMDQFREHLRMANDPSRRYLVNFQRGLLFGKGTGHHSPIGGYLADRDLVLVLDVNQAFGPWLVAAPRLFAAMDSVDSSTGKKRGMLLIE